MSGKPALQVYYDDRCALCRRARRWVEARDLQAAVEFVPLQAPETVHDTTDLVVQAPGEPNRTGSEGWVAVLAALPRWRRLSRLLSRPPLAWATAAVYRVVARHRHRLGRRPRG